MTFPPPIVGLALTEFGGVLAEREVGPGSVIVLEIVPQNAPQVLLCENDDVVEAVPPKGTDHTLAVRILPWRPRRGAESSGKASTNCWPVHCADGPSVTLKCTMRRRSCSSTRNTYRTRNVAVGTTKKSMETRSWVWFRRNVRQFCDGGFRRSGMYRDTVASPTSKPSLSNSP